MPDAEWTTALTFDQDETFSTTMNEAETFNTDMEQVVEVVTSDHRKLTHRDAEGQHPISSIINLDPELQARPSAALTNTDIQNILSI